MNQNTDQKKQSTMNHAESIGKKYRKEEKIQ